MRTRHQPIVPHVTDRIPVEHHDIAHTGAEIDERTEATESGNNGTVYDIGIDFPNNAVHRTKRRIGVTRAVVENVVPTQIRKILHFFDFASALVRPEKDDAFAVRCRFCSVRSADASAQFVIVSLAVGDQFVFDLYRAGIRYVTHFRVSSHAHGNHRLSVVDEFAQAWFPVEVMSHVVLDTDSMLFAEPSRLCRAVEIGFTTNDHIHTDIVHRFHRFDVLRNIGAENRLSVDAVRFVELHSEIPSQLYPAMNDKNRLAIRYGTGVEFPSRGR